MNVTGHCFLVIASGRFVRFTESPKLRDDDGKVLGKLRQQPIPHKPILPKPMDQYKRGALSTDYIMNIDAVDGRGLVSKVFRRGGRHCNVSFSLKCIWFRTRIPLLVGAGR